RRGRAPSRRGPRGAGDPGPLPCPWRSRLLPSWWSSLRSFACRGARGVAPGCPEDLGVDDVARRTVRADVDDVLDRAALELVVRLLGVPGEVRREDDVVERGERVVGGQRLGLVAVDAG